MADKPGYSLVPGDGGRASGLIRRRIAEEGGSGNGDGRGFLDLSLGSIYNSPSSVADDGFSPVARALLPTAPLPDASAMPSVAAAATAAYAPPAPASRTPAFAVPGDGNGGGHVLPRVSKALAVANPLLFASDGSGAVPVPFHSNATAALLFGDGSGAVPISVPFHCNATAASDTNVTPVSRSKGLGASHSAPPPPPNRKAPRGRRENTTSRRSSSGAAGLDADANGESMPPPFPWATKTVGAHPTLAELIERGISSVEGEVRCKRCDTGKTISYEIRAKFEELSGFIVRNMESMHDRAPPEWMYPVLPDCDECGQKNSLRPVIATEKWKINWMFLLLGQTLGLCTLEQLKHFCARTRQHRTGAKDRVLYSTYMELCNQLCPGGPFDMASERKNRIRPFA